MTGAAADGVTGIALRISGSFVVIPEEKPAESWAGAEVAPLAATSREASACREMPITELLGLKD
jgi:hypothetical protein